MHLNEDNGRPWIPADWAASAARHGGEVPAEVVVPYGREARARHPRLRLI